MKLDRRIQLFVVLAAFFITCLLVGDIIGGKLIELRLFGYPFILSAGMIPFPLTFVITDLLNEFYGQKAARFITLVGFAMAITAFAIIQFGIVARWAPFTFDASWTATNQRSFDNVFAGSKRILIASMVAYLIAQFTDIAVFHFLKRWSQNRYLWLRATGSTVFSQVIDTITVQVIAWYGVLPAGEILGICLNSYAVKLLVAVGLTPVIYAGHAVLERQLGLHPVRLSESGEESHDAVENLGASAEPQDAKAPYGSSSP